MELELNIIIVNFRTWINWLENFTSSLSAVKLNDTLRIKFFSSLRNRKFFLLPDQNPQINKELNDIPSSYISSSSSTRSVATPFSHFFLFPYSGK